MPTISGVGNKSNISFSNKNIYKATNNFINQKIQQFTDAFSRKNDYETIDYNAQNVTENTTQTKDRSIVSTYLQTRATFTLSTVSGILSVGEDIADGGAIVLGGLTSKIVGKFDPEKGKAIENSVSKFVKEDYMDRLYDAAVTTIGIDEDIAYGKTHTAGNIVGNIAGYAAITLTTGGVATVAISGLAAAGNAAETALNSGATFNQTFAVSLVAGAIGALSGGALDKIGEKILIQKVVNPKTLVKYIASGSLVSMSEPVVNKVTEYLTYGKNLSDNFFDYFKETGGITNTLIAGAVGSLSVAGKAYKGYSEMKALEDIELSNEKINKSVNPSKKQIMNDNVNNVKTKFGKSKTKVFAEYNGDLKSYISDGMPKKLSPLEKARYIYCKLNNEVSYSSKWTFEDRLDYNFELDRDAIYNKKIDLSNYNGEEIVCSNWSEMYAELLKDNGINCYVRGNNGSHKWVVFETNGRYYFADATNEYINATDLVNVQSGATTAGFIEITKEQAMSNTFAHNRGRVVDAIMNSKLNLNKLDKKLGFNFEDAYDLFSVRTTSNSKRMLKHLGLNVDASTKDIIEAKLEKDLFQKMRQMGVIEGIKYFNLRGRSIFTMDELRNIVIKWIVNKDTGEMSALYTVSDGKNYLYSGKNNIKLVDNNFASNYKDYGFVDYKRRQ